MLHGLQALPAFGRQSHRQLQCTDGPRVDGVPDAAHLGAADMALTVSGRNLATWTSYRGLDPEVNASGPEGLTREDLFTQPLARYWTARLDLSF